MASGPLGAEVREERKALFWTLSPLCCFGSLPSSVVSGTLLRRLHQGHLVATHVSRGSVSVLTQGPAGCQRSLLRDWGATACSLVSPAGKWGG